MLYNLASLRALSFFRRTALGVSTNEKVYLACELLCIEAAARSFPAVKAVLIDLTIGQTRSAPIEKQISEEIS